MIQCRVMNHETVTHISSRRWIHSNDGPFGVSTREEMDARVMDLDGTLGSENVTWIGSRMGKVVNVCASVNHTVSLSISDIA